MITRLFKTYGIHVLLWLVMLAYFIFAPDLLLRFNTKVGKPLQVGGGIPSGSNRIKFVVEDLESYVRNGERLSSLYGWAFIVPESSGAAENFVREIALVSDRNVYFFPVESGYRQPGSESSFRDAGIDLNTLGFNALIAEDAIKPGKYRIGIVFRNLETGSSYYSDKPAHYLVKTPNTLRFEKR